MPDTLFTDTERKVLSYCVRGTPSTTASERISEFFKMSKAEVNDALKKLKSRGLIIETHIGSVTAYTTSPIKVKRAMIDESIVEQVAAKERGASAGGFKRKTFDADTGAAVAKGPKKGTFDFDVE